jgi:hypothetical protein
MAAPRQKFIHNGNCQTSANKCKERHRAQHRKIPTPFFTVEEKTIPTGYGLFQS